VQLKGLLTSQRINRISESSFYGIQAHDN